MDQNLQEKLINLKLILSEMKSTVIAFSGGVDSAVLARIAYEVLDNRAAAITADSPSLPRRELEDAKHIAELIGINHIVFNTNELADNRYANNPTNRCYYCKSETFMQIKKLATQMGFDTICYGENLDDQGDYRPGAQAAIEFAIRAPLKEALLTKEDIRALARQFGLPNWDKPAAACLSSRIPYGKTITIENLAQVEQAEDLLWRLGLQSCRVRHHGEIARIEIPSEEMALVLTHAQEIVHGLQGIGFRFVTLDLAGYRRGVFDQEVIPTASIEFSTL